MWIEPLRQNVGTGFVTTKHGLLCDRTVFVVARAGTVFLHLKANDHVFNNFIKVQDSCAEILCSRLLFQASLKCDHMKNSQCQSCSKLGPGSLSHESGWCWHIFKKHGVNSVAQDKFSGRTNFMEKLKGISAFRCSGQFEIILEANLDSLVAAAQSEV